jgi:hypothetical protein
MEEGNRLEMVREGGTAMSARGTGKARTRRVRFWYAAANSASPALFLFLAAGASPRRIYSGRVHIATQESAALAR